MWLTLVLKVSHKFLKHRLGGVVRRALRTLSCVLSSASGGACLDGLASRTHSLACRGLAVYPVRPRLAECQVCPGPRGHAPRGAAWEEARVEGGGRRGRHDSAVTAGP